MFFIALFSFYYTVPAFFFAPCGATKTGSAKLTAHVRSINASTGKTVHEKNISLADQQAMSFPGDAPGPGRPITRHVRRVIRSK
jgi:hypothetical protein